MPLILSFFGIVPGEASSEELSKADHLYRQGPFDKAAQAYE